MSHLDQFKFPWLGDRIDGLYYHSMGGHFQACGDSLDAIVASLADY